MFHVEQTRESMDMEYDIAIIGGGHAGVEAAWIAAQFDLSVCIVTMPGVPLASAPCNPAIGGVGKAQVVREIDALGGLMGRMADLSGIQFRTLNESKGYAVQSTRAQIDKEYYAEVAEGIISNSKIDVIRVPVEKINKVSKTFVVEHSDGCFRAKRVVLTTGTFLSGKMHTGTEVTVGGRVGAKQSVGLEAMLSKVKKLEKSFKTGTPPRIKRSSIDFSKMEEQMSDISSMSFHIGNDTKYRNLEQVSCFLTRTTADTLRLIRNNKERSPIFNGQIKGTGPRYCPSIEDKAFRYLDKDIHHVFVEPEGLGIDTFYPNGISTSLPVEIQESFLRTIPGLEKSEIAIKGYAVEYDVVDTLCLKSTLEHESIGGLYFAGQVCGTSGYEEAAGQGIIAGINAALSSLGREPFILKRSDSYIGVLIDDLVTNVRDEPYRLFTARSENRLYLREDNAFLRMYPYRKSLNINNSFDRQLDDLTREFEELQDLVGSIEFKEDGKNFDFFVKNNWKFSGRKVLLSEVLTQSQVDPVEALCSYLGKVGLCFNKKIIASVAISKKYEGYINKSLVENERFTRIEVKPVAWQKLIENKNISFECKSRISTIKPETFGQLKRIEGIRPATLAMVASTL